VANVRQLRAFGQRFSALRLDAAAVTGDGAGAKEWKSRVDSDQAAGQFIWRDEGDGMLIARFQRLRLDGGKARARESDGDSDSDSDSETDDERDGEEEEPALRSLPGVDARVETFVWGETALGQVEVRAHNQDGVWLLEHFSARPPEAHISGSGRWHAGPTPHTDLDFVLTTTNIGRFLRALGYHDAVRGGQATLEGRLDWRGAPINIDYPSLGGQLALTAANGRFAQLEPGVGRLLGVLSLQALPRRISLDFRDVFSQGFVFDRIAGEMTVEDGVIYTDGIQIAGPAARGLMQGEADLEAETQDLRVGVRPAMAESVAIVTAAGLVNPVAGAVTYLGQKVLGDPIEKLFAYEYKITGSWVDPVVEKVRSNNIWPVPPDGDQ
jgi:uncharacterized protein YhdP